MPRAILAIRLSALGDVANMLPAIGALRRAFPQSRIDYVVEDRHRELVEGHPDLNAVIVYPRKRWRYFLTRPWYWPALAAEMVGYVQRLRLLRYDVVLDFQGNLKGAMHAVAARSAVRVGYAGGHTYEGAHFFATRRVTPPGKRIPRVEKYMSMVRALSADAQPAAPTVGTNPTARTDIAAFQEARRLKPGGYVVVHPGTSAAGAGKRWAPERFAALCERIHTQLGLPCVVAWGPGERDLASAVCSAAPHAAAMAPETRTVHHLIELIRGARLFVGADSGPLHVAAAAGRTCVGLFGSKDPAIYAPYPRERHIVVRSRTEEMEDLTVDEAFEGVRRAAER